MLMWIVHVSVVCNPYMFFSFEIVLLLGFINFAPECCPNCLSGAWVKGKKKKQTKTFCGRKWPVGTPLLTTEKKPQKIYVGPFFRPFPGNEAHNFFLFSGGPKSGFWVGPKSFMLKKLMCFICPLWVIGPKLPKLVETILQ